MARGRPILAIRFDPETVEALDDLASALSAYAGGVEVSRSEAARRAVAYGIPALQKELGIKPPKRGRK